MYLPTRLPTDETETRADPFSLDALIAWLRTKNPEERYSYCQVGTCLMTQYFKASTVGFVRWSGCRHWTDEAGVCHEISAELEGIAVVRPWTFGAALSRATAIRGV